MSPPTLEQKRLGWLLWGLPLWLVVSAGIALWFYYHREKMQTQEEQERFSKSVSIASIEDDLHKLVKIIGERNTTSEKAKENLSRAASMAEGLLGPSNIGYVVHQIPGPAEWPILQVSVRGSDRKAAPLWIVTSYDSPQGSSGAELNAIGLAATLAAAQAVASDKPRRGVDFFFLPHANDASAPVDSVLAKLAAYAKSKSLPIAAWYVGGGMDEISDKLAKLGLRSDRFRVQTSAAPDGEKIPDARRAALSAERLIKEIRNQVGKSPP